VLLIPAIDLRKGKTVRLIQGDYEKEKDYGHEPLDLAKKFQDTGAKRIHIVDLDGAKGDGSNRQVIIDIANKLTATIDTGGGIRTMVDIEELIAGGVQKIVLGTVAVENPQLVKEAVKHYGDKVSVGVDALSGLVKVKGWLESTPVKADILIRQMIDFGVQEIIYTDIARDGTLAGPNYEALEILVNLPVKIIASGGVASLVDLKKLRKLPLYGVIVGKALYEGTFSLEEALEVYK